MSSKEKEKKKKNFKLDKQSSASLVLAFTVLCFMFTMFTASNQIGTSYAISTEANDLPESLTFKGIAGLNKGDGVHKAWEFMQSNEIITNTSLAVNFDFQATDGTNIYDMYCIEGKIDVTDEEAYTLEEKDLDETYAKGLAYILNNSYPNDENNADAIKYMSVCNDEAGDNVRACKKYITQYSIWYYLYKEGVTYKNTSSSGTVIDDIQRDEAEFTKIEQMAAAGNKYAIQVVNLSKDAINYNANHQAAYSIGINISDIKYSITNDGKYLESNYLSVTPNEQYVEDFKGYSATLTNNTYDAIIIDQDGVEQPTSFTKNSTFKIRIPIEKVKEATSMNLGVQITGYFPIYKVYAYEPANKSQRPIIAKPVVATANSQAPFDFKLTEITKTDITNGKPVSGATLTIKDSNGKEVASWTTTEDAYYISLNPGDYTLTEVTSPEGYELNSETIPFTVQSNGTITKVEMKNTPTTPVPDTAENVPIYLYIIGGMILIIGVGVIYVTTKPKKNS